jgi:predicted GNAT family N-acyltransferase
VSVQVQLQDWPAAQVRALAIRETVFVQEQGVDPALEIDGRDAECLHALAIDSRGDVVGTGRLLPDGRIGRMAVLAAHRGRGVGAALLVALVNAARTRGDSRIWLHAQTQAAGLYRRHGFVPIGETFMEAGIEHIEMELP